eukprot:6761779-Prymnesium_polylepis.1
MKSYPNYWYRGPRGKFVDWTSLDFLVDCQRTDWSGSRPRVAVGGRPMVDEEAPEAPAPMPAKGTEGKGKATKKGKGGRHSGKGGRSGSSADVGG